MPVTARRLLVVAFHYPPDNTSTGVLRTLKFTQHLRLHGWTSDVISVPDHLYTSLDPDSVRAIPHGTRVFRPWAADTKKLFGVRGRYPAALAVPDRYWPWIVPAVRRARRLLGEERVDALYTTYPVASALLIGLRLKARFGLPWVVDFRDPWVEDSMSLLRRRTEGWLERRVLSRADRVICNTPMMRRWFLHRYPGLPGGRFVTVPNGYDEPDFARVEAESVGKFEILYPGTLVGGNRNPEPLLAGVRRALDRGWLEPGDLQVTFLGCGPYARDPRFQRDLERHRLREVVVLVEERVAYGRALRRLAGASVLVVLSEPIGDGRLVEAERRWSHLQVPAKVYEYLRLGRPILALVSGGAVAELLEETAGGVAVPPADIEGVALALKRCYETRASTSARPPTPRAAIARYSREALSAALAEQLEALVGEREAVATP